MKTMLVLMLMFSFISCVFKEEVKVAAGQSLKAPSSITLVKPLSPSSLDDSPRIQVGGVQSGDLIKLYKNSSCSDFLVSANAMGASVDIDLLDLLAGSYQIYATVEVDGLESSCSSTFLAYEVKQCPTNYARVYGNSTFGTSDFCMMTYEAKNDGAGNPISVPETVGYANVTLAEAKALCEGIGADYDLISNPEWMTAAYEIEANALNWSSGVVGTGCLFRGNTGITGPCDYSAGGVQSGTGRDTKSRLFLTSGDEVWDMSGNIWEMVDWTLGGTVDIGPTSCTESSFTDFNDVSCGALAAIDYLPGNPAGIPAANYDRSYGVGSFLGLSGGVAARGTNWNDGTSSGVFTMTFQAGPTVRDGNLGFRCILRM